MSVIMHTNHLSLCHRAQEHTLSQSQSQYIKAKVNTSYHMKKTEEAGYTLKKGQKQLAIKEQELAESRQEITELEKTWRNYKRQVQEQGAVQGRDIELDEDQVMIDDDK